MTATSDGYYMAEIPNGGYKQIIFVRMDDETTDNNWNNKWNQTADIKLPTDGSNLFTLNANGWDNIGGTWSKK
jgi:peroxiredoxin